MNDLERYFWGNKGKLIHKWIHYFDAYDAHFSRYRNKNVIILEIGVSQGGSLQMWKDYFGPGAKIYGIDVDENCKNLEEENIKIFIGSQSDRNFLRHIKQSIPHVDILIDDGGHTMEQQIVTYEELFDHVKADGLYLCEDVHTSYWPNFGGGYKNAGSFIEYSKKFIDYLNVQKNKQAADFADKVRSIDYYDSIVAIEKAVHSRESGTQKTEAEYLKNHFSRYKDKEVSILEIGISGKESLLKWKNYLGAQTKIYGISTDENCKKLEEDNVRIFIGSLEDKTFLNNIKKNVPKVDILIDYGFSNPNLKVMAFENLFNHIKPDGVYLCENDYALNSGNVDSFTEYSKNFIDFLNAYHSRDKKLKVSDFTNSVSSIHYYNNVVIVQRNIRKEKPHAERTGNRIFESDQVEKPSKLKGLFKFLNKK